jgi:hypothetical protein
MNDFKAFDVAGTAYAAGALGVSSCVRPAITAEAMRHIAPAAHAAWAVDAIVPQGKRRTAHPTEASVDWGLI